MGHHFTVPEMSSHPALGACMYVYTVYTAYIYISVYNSILWLICCKCMQHIYFGAFICDSITKGFGISSQWQLIVCFCCLLSTCFPEAAAPFGTRDSGCWTSFYLAFICVSTSGKPASMHACRQSRFSACNTDTHSHMHAHARADAHTDKHRHTHRNTHSTIVFFKLGIYILDNAALFPIW